jgi:valyl-tRNA synthetase
MDEKFLKPYNSKETEVRIYKQWKKSGFFSPDICIEKGVTKPDAEPFSIVLPPPNVTGTLHMGSALMIAIEDIMVRFERMRGKRTLWIPGTDHAAIATQTRVEKDLQKEGVRKQDLGRDEFLKSHDTIIRQIHTLGASLDWSREAFTLDEKRSIAVRTAFKTLYDLGLIYRTYRIVNWDPKGQTTISDDEIVYLEQKSKLYTFKYSKDFPISISTTRPETKVGDVAVAVHPDDERYKQYIGKEYKVNFAGVDLTIAIVGDDAVDPEFGTGAVGVTPAHSQADWEIAERHKLPVIPVINEFAKMTVAAPELNNKKTAEAREVVVEWLRREGLLEREEEIVNNISTAERSGGIVEPLPKLQWFINVNKKFTLPLSHINTIADGQEVSLKDLMHAAVAGGQIKILPDRFEKVYFHWINNLRDWCISRQIWYGHRIPVWYKNNDVYVGIEAPREEGWAQDEDTLDTWFSSGLWTFSTLGWPEKTADLKAYHPTSVLETGYDILPFWVARMILMSTALLGEIPFRTVYLHGLVRDSQGRKISKSLGNNIDPVDMAEKYGADAVRMSLIIGTGPGNDSKISEEKLKAYKHFANKIWNATRFTLTSIDTFDTSTTPTLAEHDTQLLSELEQIIKDVTHDMDTFKFYLAGDKLYHYFWHTFADIIIEESKPILAGTDEKAKVSRQYTLFEILKTTLKTLHPFMPFITEEIWQSLPGNTSLLMIEKWPTS